MPTVQLDKQKAKEDTEAYKEVMSTLRRLLNKYEEGKNRYQTLQRMMNSRTYPIKSAGRDEKVQDKDEGDTKQNGNLQVDTKAEERENSVRPEEGNEGIASMVKGGDRTKNDRIKGGDRNKEDNRTGPDI